MGNTGQKILFKRTNSRSSKKMNNKGLRNKEFGHEMSESEHEHGMVIEQPKDNRYDKEDENSQQRIQPDQSAEKEDNKGENWLHNLKKSLNQHCNLIGGLDATLEAQRGTILLQYIAENTEHNAGDISKTKGAKQTLVEGAVDILMNIKKSCESVSGPLKDSFKTLHADIDKSLEHFGKSRILIDTQRERKVSETVQKEGETSNAEVRKLGEEVRQLKENESKQKNEINDLQKQNRNLTSALEHYRPRNGPATTQTIQLFYIHGGNTIKNIEVELKAMVTNKLRNISFQTCIRATDIDPNKLVIVLYIVTTRVGADADNAITDIKNPGNTILMLIHYKEVHSLSSERSSDVLNGEKFRNLRGILDLAFMTDSGFFHCEMNESNIDALCALCRERSGGDRL